MILVSQKAIEACWREYYGTEKPDKPDTGPEKRLQAKCLEYCKEHGFLVWHDWSRKKNQPGWPDLMVFLPEGKVRLIELKSGGRKLRKEQQEISRHMLFLGHRIYVARSFKRFLEVMKDV